MHVLPLTTFLTAVILFICIVIGVTPHPSERTHTAVPADTVDIENANRVFRSVIDDTPVQVFEGDVRMRQKEIFLHADKVTRFLTKDEYLLEGNVLIIQQTDSMFADNVRYDSNRKIGYARGNVRLSDGEVQVFSPSATHYTEEKWTLFNEDVRLIDSLTVLTSLKGEYFSEPRRAEFYGDVLLEEDNTYLKSDSITYFRETEISYGYGNVFIERIGGDTAGQDSSNTRTFLFGDYIYNDNNSGYSLIEGNAFLFQVQQDSMGVISDSLLIKSSRLEAMKIDSLQRLTAVDSVTIWRSNFSAIADSAVYDRISMKAKVIVPDDSLGILLPRKEEMREENRLFGNPVAWFKEYQLSGDSLLAKAIDGSIDSLFASENAFVAYLDTATQKINQLQGLTLLGLFRQDSLESLAVGPQAEAIYFQKGQEGQTGALKATGDRILLLFSANELSDIKVYSGVVGEYYDGSLVPAAFQLSRFRWLIDQKPVENSMVDRIPVRAYIDERLSPQVDVAEERRNTSELAATNN